MFVVMKERSNVCLVQCLLEKTQHFGPWKDARIAKLRVGETIFQNTRGYLILDYRGIRTRYILEYYPKWSPIA